MPKNDRKEKSGDITVKFSATMDPATYGMLRAAQEAGRPVSLRMDEEGARHIFGDDTVDTMKRVLASEKDGFVSLCKVAGLDPAEDLIDGNFKGVEFEGDLIGFNLDNTILRETDFTKATHLRNILSCQDADISDAKMTAAQYKILKNKGAIGQPLIQPTLSTQEKRATSRKNGEPQP